MDTIDLDYENPDSDGDGLSDGEEVGERCSQRLNYVDGCNYYLLNSNPDATDSDEDGLDDETESKPQVIQNVVADADGNPSRYDESEGSSTLAVTSDPLREDSDEDGVNDYDELTKLHTAPSQKTTFGATKDRNEFLHELYEEWDEADGQTKENLEESFVAVGLIEETSDIHQLRHSDLTDGTDDFDFVFEGPTQVPHERLVFETPDGVRRTDTWFSNREELRSGTDPWKADMDSDGLTDGQEVKWVTKAPPLEEVTRDQSITEQTDPTNPDSDGDSTPDGGGHYSIGDYTLGGTPGKGETWHLPTDPTSADVVKVYVATDSEFRNQHSDHRSYVRNLVEYTNTRFQEEFSGEDDVPPYLLITGWGLWASDDSMGVNNSTTEYNDHLEEDLHWPENDHGADLLSGFTGQPMGATEYQKNQGGSQAKLGEYVDAAENGTSTLIGTSDPTTRIKGINYDLVVDNFYQHEIGHIFGAEHPGDTGAIDDGTPGVMCKYTCMSLNPFEDGSVDDSMFFSNHWNPQNREWIKNKRKAVATLSERRDK